MRVIDIDSHFQEPIDWLYKVDATLARKLPRVGELDAFIEIAFGNLISSLPAHDRPDLLSLAPPTLRRWLEAGRDPFSDHELVEMMARSGMSSPAAHVASERISWMNERGIELQVVLPTSAYILYRCTKRMQQHAALALPLLQAYNTWAAEQLKGHTDRLVPVMLLDLDDVTWSLCEMERMHAAGSRVALICAEPARHRSLVHPDLDAFWSSAADLSIVIMFHVGGGHVPMSPGWLNCGGSAGPFLRQAALARRLVPELALAALVFGGVLERHPHLGIVVSELGIDWLPSFLEKIDALAEPCEANEPLGRPYDLPLKPSEYIRRQVRVSVVQQHDRLYPTLERVPPGIVVFASDFPHPEGSQNAIALYSAELGAAGPAASEAFFFSGAATVLGAAAAAASRHAPPTTLSRPESVARC